MPVDNVAGWWYNDPWRFERRLAERDFINMKVFDIHAHIYPNAIADRAVYAISHAYDDFPVKNDGRLETLVGEMDDAGVTACAAHSVATTPHQVESINRFVMAAARRHPGRIVPFATLHPDMDDPGGAVDALVKAGFRGVKLHPEFQNFKVDEPRAAAMFDAAAGRLPVLLHCGDYRCDNSAPERIKRMLREVKGLTLICAHLGGWTTWEMAAAELIGADVWVDTSSSLYALDGPTAAAIIRGYGVERALFGSDYPMWVPGEEIDRLLALPLTDGEKEKILWDNHLALLGDKI